MNLTAEEEARARAEWRALKASERYVVISFAHDGTIVFIDGPFDTVEAATTYRALTEATFFGSPPHFEGEERIAVWAMYPPNAGEVDYRRKLT
jgi:hypothetical protein